jgi:C1A family cysteine protease
MNYISPKKIIIILLSITIVGLALIGQNCSVKQNLSSTDDNGDSSSLVNEQEVINSRANSANSTNLIVSSKAVNADDPNSIKTLLNRIKVSGGKLVQVLPSGELEIEFPNLTSANSFASANHSIIEVQKTTDMSSAKAKRRAKVRSRAPVINASTVILLKKEELVSKSKNNLNTVKREPKLGQKRLFNLRKNISLLATNDSSILAAGDSTSPIVNLHDNSNSLQFPPIGNQGGLGSCVAWSMGYYLNSYTNAVTEAINYPESKNSDLQNNPDSTLLCSPAFLYPHINSGHDAGSGPENAGVSLLRQGCVSIKDMPLSKMSDQNGLYKNRFFPSVPMQIKAMKNRIESYQAEAEKPLTEDSLVTLKEKVDQGILISTAIAVYDSFFKYQGLTTETVPVSCGNYNYPQGVYSNLQSCVLDENGNPKLAGYHEITIVGYDDSKQAFKVANSWGDGWGEKGFIWISYDLFKNKDFSVSSFYSLTDFDTEPVLSAYVIVTENYEKANYSVGKDDNNVITDYFLNLNFQLGLLKSDKDFVYGGGGGFLVVPTSNFQNGNYLKKKLDVIDVSSYFPLNSNTDFFIKFNPDQPLGVVTDAQLFLYNKNSPTGSITHNYSNTDNKIWLSYSANPSTNISAPVIYENPQNVTTNVGLGPVIFQVVANGTDLFYQWYKDGQKFGEKTKRAFVNIYGISKAIDNTTYSVEVSNSKGTVKSASATLKVLDQTPQPFRFNVLINQPVSTLLTSNQITLRGIDNGTKIQIDFGTYSVNGGSFTSEPGVVNNGDKIQLQRMSSSEYDDLNYATVYVGSYFADFIIRTESDLYPDLITFNPIVNARVNTVYTSNEVTITGLGIDGGYIEIFGDGGTYKINNTNFRSSTDHVSNGDKIQLRLSTSSTRKNLVTTVTVGKNQSKFKVDF